MDTPSTKESILALADELEKFFWDNASPIADNAALRRVKFLCGQLGAYDHYVGEKADDIVYLAGRFFSAKKHEGVAGGAEEIFNRIVRQLLPNIRTRANNIDYAERNP